MLQNELEEVLIYTQKLIDISVTLKSGMVHWPGDPPVRIKRILSLDKGHQANVSGVKMGLHSGTHIDAPLHFIRNGRGIDQMPLDATIGPARVIEIKDKESIKTEELKKHKIRRGERILLKSINSRLWRSKSNTFKKNFVYISKEAAEYLARKSIRAVGIDYLSIGGFYKDSAETHQALLKAGVWAIEGLNLSQVKEGRYHLVCLPIKIFKSDGAPARAVLYPLNNKKK